MRCVLKLAHAHEYNARQTRGPTRRRPIPRLGWTRVQTDKNVAGPFFIRPKWRPPPRGSHCGARSRFLFVFAPPKKRERAPMAATAVSTTVWKKGRVHCNARPFLTPSYPFSLLPGNPFFWFLSFCKFYRNKPHRKRRALFLTDETLQDLLWSRYESI